MLNRKSIIGSLMVLGIAGTATARAEETLRFATWDTDESLAIQQEIAKKFEEKHPGVKVQVEPYA
ncbi:MAG: sugar ABC transporter substrate-binding protein, partial [Ensifer adhaerens]